MVINAHTSVYCILGNPVRHSLSPIMHNAAFAHTGINAVYVAFEPASIKQAFNAIKALGIKGASITIPFKVDVLPLCDSVDTLASRIGSVNTLVNADGMIQGYNTDGYGLLRSLETHSIEYHNKKVLIIGNGGSARAIAYTLAQHNTHITICGRNSNNITQLANDLRKYFTDIETILIDKLTPDITAHNNIIINTTPVGMKPDISRSPIDISLLHPHNVVVDIIYSPLRTQLVQNAQEKGCTVITGDYMLLFQACMQFELWTGKTAPIDIMHQALKQALQ
ncbi:MAG: shikimate dehydrogenase [Spirochaetota bacterium]|nr:shikimate dehydrogenase [Spirochaetota bacterium]